MIKIWCEECKGKGDISQKSITNVVSFIKCFSCKGKGYTEHQGSLEDLECAEIERLLLSKNIGFAYYSDPEDTEFTIMLYPKKNSITGRGKKRIDGKTKLEVLRKAKELVKKGGNE